MDVICLRCGEPFSCDELDDFPPEFFEGIDVLTCCDLCVEQISAEIFRKQGALYNAPAPEEPFDQSCGGNAALFEDLALM